MSTRRNKIVLFLALAAAAPAGPVHPGPVRVAVVPAENRTGDTDLDYLGDLIFNLLAAELSGFRGLELFERARADLLFRERRLSPEILAEIRPAVPVDLIVGGAYFFDREAGEKLLELSALRLSGDGEKVSARREVSSFDPAAVISAVGELVREGLARPFGWEERDPPGGEARVPGKKVAVTGFNNYSPRTGYDPLQKGIVYLIEERLGRDPGLAVLEREKLKEVSREIFLAGALGDTRFGLRLPAADLLVAGYFTFSGEDFILGARVIDVPTTRIAAVISRRAPVSGAAGAVRDLTEELAGRLGCRRPAEEPPAEIYPATPEALLYYSRGAELYDRGEYLPAIEQINRAVAVDPGYTFGSYQAGRIYEEHLALPGRAVGAYRQVLAGPAGPALREKTLLRLGMLSYRRQADPATAAGYFREFLEEFPGSSYRGAVLHALGDACRQEGEYREALEAYRRALELPGFNPLRGGLLVRAGQCLYELEDYPAAGEYFRRARDDHGGEIYRSEIGARPVTVSEAAERYLSRMKE